MSLDNNTYNQVYNTPYNQVNPLGVSQTAQSQKSNIKKWMIAIIGVVVLLLVVVLLIIVITTNNRTSQKTEMMVLYEQLGDEITYGDLEEKVKEIVPKASISYEDGVYTIQTDDGNDLITCLTEDNRSGESVENEESGEDIDLDAILDEIMSEDESDLEEELDEENADTENEGMTAVATIPDISPSTLMVDFVYYYYEEIDEMEEDEDELMEDELYIEKSNDGYLFFDGEKTYTLHSKSGAMDMLLGRIL